MVIRQARPEDAEEVLAYLCQVGSETDNLSFGPEGLPFTVEQEAQYLKDQLDSQTNVVLVAVEDGRIIGEASLDSQPRRMAHRAEVGLSVVKSAWHRGVGMALMAALLDYARQSGLEVLTLEVRSDNARAIRLYERFDFQKVGTHPRYMKLGKRYMDMDIMYCVL